MKNNSKRIKEIWNWRKQHGYNQEGFAELLGISRGSVSNYERDKLDIPDPVWHRFLDVKERHPSKTNAASDHPTNKAEDPTTHEDPFVTIQSGSGASVLKSLWRKRVDAFHAFRVERRQRFLFLKKPDICDALALMAHIYLVYFVLHAWSYLPMIFPISVAVILFFISVPTAYIGSAVLFYELWTFFKQLNARYRITIKKHSAS